MLENVLNLVKNKFTIMTNVSCRTFSRKYENKALAGIRNKMKFVEDEQLDIEETDAQDLSEFEADFMNVAQSYKMHKREMANQKEHLKQQITVTKYYKEKEPRFITFAEKEMIRTLHESDPEEWSIEKLSESFPVLPETIKRILHSKWSPKSIEKVIQYDNVVIENWKKFHAGKLPMDPILNKHLIKFKGRKIILTDRELLAKKFISPKPVFKKPKSQLFTNIVQPYLNETQSDTISSLENNKTEEQESEQNKLSDIFNHDQNQNLLISNTMTTISPIVVNNSKKSILNKKENCISKLQGDSTKHNIVPYNKNINVDQQLTFNEFLRTNLQNISKMSPEESITLMDVYKKQINDTAEKQNAEITTASNNTVAKIEKNSSVPESNSDIIVANDDLVDTHIKIWKKKINTECSYIKPIKIAKNVYKPGMTYRVNDCYYDDDGEFLYRIPGVRS